jgi:hypothetical protein
VSDDAPRLAQPSAAEDWFERGKTFVENHNYALAAQCFERAPQGIWLDLAKAHDLRLQAHHMRGGSTPALQRRATAYQAASDAFAACSTAAGDENAKLAAECREKSRRDTLEASSLSRPARVKASAGQSASAGRSLVTFASCLLSHGWCVTPCPQASGDAQSPAGP